MGTTKYRTTDISILQDFGRDKHGLSEHSGIQVAPKFLERLRELVRALEGRRLLGGLQLV